MGDLVLSSTRVILLAFFLTIFGRDVGGVRASDLAPDWKGASDWTTERGLLLKPGAEASPPNDLYLMPLIVIGQADSGADPKAKPESCEKTARIVSVKERDGELDKAGGAPVVYVVSGTMDVGGVPLRQWTFVWWISSPEGTLPAICAIRMTLDAKGRPIIWEVVGQSHRTVGVLVAESFVEAVRTEHGDPPDWSHSDLLAPHSRLHATFVRVLDDGPAPMGPMVYCDRRGAIVTVACRCMPSQVGQVVRNEYYRVVRLRHLAEIDDLLSISGDAALQRLLTEWRRPTWLTDALRWPKEPR